MNNKNNEPLRVAQVIGKWLGGGVESVIMNYYRHIDHNKIQFDFICDEDSTCIPREEIEKLGGKVIVVPPYQKLNKYLKELKRIFKENKYQIVHSNINALSVFPLYAAKKAGVPVRIAHSHSTSNKKEWKKTLLKNVLRPFSKVYATDYFACSELAGRWLFGNKTFEQGKVTIINNAIDLDKFKYDEKIRKEKRKELGINDDTLVIGHIGRFVAQKNHTFLIDIFTEIFKENSNSVLLLAGEGPLKDEIQNKVKELGLEENVKFLGQRKDANELYQAFDVFLLPSLYEGLPVVGVEAQAAGLLCVLSDDMTKETKIIDSTIFMSLKEKTCAWTNTLLERFNDFERKNTEIEISDNGFNIERESNKLEYKYLEMSSIENQIRKRILYFVDNLNFGGIQSFIMNLIDGFNKNEFDIEILTLNYGEESVIEKQLKQHGVNVYRSNEKLNNILSFIKYGQFLKKFFVTHKYDVVHVHGSSKNYMVLKYAKKNNVATRIIHSHSTSFQTNSKSRKIIGNIMKMLMKKYANKFLACSYEAGLWLFGKKIVNGNSFYVIKNCIKNDKYIYNSKIRNVTREELNIKKDAVIIGHVGRMIEIKNHSYLLKVFKEYQKLNRNSKLLLIGTGPLEDQLKQEAKDLKIDSDVLFLGFQSETNKYLQALDIFVLPSLFEGLPMVLVEAQTNGLKCFVSDKVSREAKLSDNLEFININEVPEKFAEKIFKTNYERNNNVNLIKKRGFFLEDVVNVLADIYLK